MTTYATFGNTQFSKGFDFTFAPGVQPSVCRLRTLPHTQSLPQVATLTLITDGQQPLVFPDCLLAQPQLDAGRGGQYWTLPLYDRRWKWQWGEVKGHYNDPQPDGTYRNEKTPRELATILLTAMNETGFDVGRLPNDTRPEYRWDGENPATELDGLCAQHGCVVCLNWLTNKVEIWPVGDGLALPVAATDGQSYAPVLPPQPSKIKTEAGETLFQATFATEPVGQDTDGRWKHIDSLSYRPANGWSPSQLGSNFEAVIPDTAVYNQNGQVLKVRDLVASCLYRCYRLTGILGQAGANAWAPPLLQNTPMAPQSLKDIQLLDQLADEEISTVDGALRPKATRTFARWQPADKDLPHNTITLYPNGTPGLDPEHGILQFGEPLFLWGSPNYAAEVRFECAFLAGRGGIYHRRSVEASTGAPDQTPTRLVQVPELQLRVKYRYNNAGNQTDVEQDTASIDSKLTYYQNAALEEYGLQNGGTVNYTQLMRIAPDGLTQQVTWQGGGGRAAYTIVSQAQRHNRFIKPLDEQRERQLVKQLQQQQWQRIGRLAAIRVGGAA